MPNIRASSDIRNKYNEISQFCHQYDEPVFITKNGKGDLAILSVEAYEKLVGKLELSNLIKAGLDDVKNGKVKDFKKVFLDLKEDFKNGTL